jgi:PAS domain S-box-containing protein
MDTRNRAMLIILFVIIAMSSAFMVLCVYEYRKSYQELVAHHDRTISFLFKRESENLNRMYASRLKGFASVNSRVLSAFFDNNRNELINASLPRFNVLKNEHESFYDIRFIKPDGSLLLSSREPEVFGQNLTVSQYVKDIQTNSDVISGFLVANGKLFYQIALRVINDGSFAGIIEFRIETLHISRLLKDLYGSDHAIAVINESVSESMKNLASGVEIVTKNSEIFSGLPHNFNFDKKFQNIMSEGASHQIHSERLYNYQNKLIGYYLTSVDISGIKGRFQSLFLYIILLTIAGIILSAIVLYTSFGTILKRIESINFNLENIVSERTKELNLAKEQALAQKAIINSLYRRFKNMFQDHHSVMFLIDPESGRIVDTNHAGTELLKKDKQDLTGLYVKDFSMLPQSSINEILQNAAHTGLKNYISKFRIMDAVIDLEIQASPIDVEGKTLIFAICHDVTEKMMISNQLKDINKNLENMVADETEKRRQQEILLIQQSKMSAVGELLSVIIHQWKQPMTAVSYLMQDLSDSCARGAASDKYIRNIADEALNQINYMTETVNDFRKFLMPSKTKENFNVVESLLTTVKLLNKQFEKDSIECSITLINANTETTSFDYSEIDGMEQLEISTDCFMSYGYPNEFKQVLMNIFNNARDALRNKEYTQESKCRFINVVVSCAEDMIEVSIADNAGGIPAEIQDKIFSPYFTTKETKGTGIGLYMAKNIIENHMQGTISTQNSSVGAVFNINLRKV